MARTIRKTKVPSKVAPSKSKSRSKPKFKPKSQAQGKRSPSAAVKKSALSKAKPEDRGPSKVSGKGAKAKPTAKTSASADSAKTKAKKTTALGKAKARTRAHSAKAMPTKKVSATLADTKAKKAAAQQAGKGKGKAKSKPSRIADGMDLEVVALGKPGQMSRRVLRPKSFPDFATEKHYGHQAGTPDIPLAYGLDRLVLMPKDPEWLFAYWELTPQSVEAKWPERLPDHEYQEALKLSWDARELFDQNYVFLPVQFSATRWYLAVPGNTSQAYSLELGWLGEDGHFIPLLRSEQTGMPERWTVTRENLLANGKVTAYSARRTVTLGASEHAVIEESRGVWNPENLSSGLFSSSSLAMGQKSPGKTEPRGRMDTVAKVEVSGTLPRGSTVIVAGKEFHPDPKGKFKAVVETHGPTLHLEVVPPEGKAKFFAYDLTAPAI